MKLQKENVAQALTFIPFEGRRVIPATVLGRVLGYGKSGLTGLISKEWAPHLKMGLHFDVLTGPRLSAFKSQSGSVGSRARQVMIVLEEGVSEVLAFTHKLQQPTPSLVYFVQCRETGVIKIGTSTDVSRRVAVLASQSNRDLQLLGTRSGGRAEERRLHRKFSKLRLRGEWFRETPELLAEIHGDR